MLRRADGFIAYQLAMVVDELCFGITDVVRGEDLRSSLLAQFSVYAALAQLLPRFLHVPLLRDQHGQKLSKREASKARPVAGCWFGRAADVSYVSLSREPGARLSTHELLQHLMHQSADAADS